MRFIKYLFILVLFTVLFLGAGAFLLRDKITSYFVNEITAEAAKQNINIHMGSAEFVPFAFKVGEMSLRYFYKFIPLQVDLENLLIKPDWVAAFNKQLSVNVSLNTLDGSVQMQLNESNRNVIVPKLMVRDLDLSKHRQIRPLGIVSGKLSLEAKDIKSNAGLTSVDQLIVKLADLNLPHETVLPTWATGLPVVVKFPPILAEKLDVALQATDFGYRLTQLDLDSDLGNLDCLGSFKGQAKPILETLSCDVFLTDNGLKHLSDWISLFSSGKVKNQQRFSFDLKGTDRGIPSVKFILPDQGSS